MEDEISLVDIIKVILKYKKLITWLFIVSLTAALIYSLFAPKQYQATASILPIESSTGSLATALGAFTGMGGQTGGSARIMAVIKSKNIAQGVINDLDLLPVMYKDNWYKVAAKLMTQRDQVMAGAAGKLIKQLDVKSNKDGIIQISIDWETGEGAAAISNKYVEKLSDFLNSRSLNVTFQKIDPAIAPLKPYKPKLLLNLVLSGVASLFVGVMLAFMIDYFKSLPPIK